MALVAGALPALVFPEPGLWWLAWVVLTPLLALTARAPSAREAGVLGWAWGTGFVLAAHFWLLPSVLVFLPLVAAVVGLLWLPFGRAARALLRPPLDAGRCARALVVLPAVWLLAELVRSWDRLGGPWALLGASQWQVAPVRALAAVGGVWLVSVLVVLVNVAVTVAIRRDATRAARRTAVLATLAVPLVSLVWASRPGPPVSGTVDVAVVQPGVVEGAAARFAAAEALTRGLAGRQLDLVVWGESAVGFDLDRRTDLRDRLSDLSRFVAADLLVNVDARRPGATGIYKSSVLIGPDGVLGRYDKQRLVPFGEYVPLRPVLGWTARFTEVAAEDRRRGAGLVVLDADGLRVGPLVCFESAFPDLSRRLAAAGADLLVFQTATTTFQDSWAPEQHASIAALRAAESGRPVVHATLSGVSAVYDATGRRLGPALGTEQTGTLVVNVPLVAGTTPYVAVGHLGAPMFVGLVLATLGVVWTARRAAEQDDAHA